MNLIDIAIVILILYQIATGLRKGFLRSLLDLTGIVAALVVSMTQFGLITNFLERVVDVSPDWLGWFSLLACLGITIALVNAVINMVKQPLQRWDTKASVFSRLLGLLIGATRGGVIASLLLLMYVFMPLTNSTKSQLNGSSLAPRVIPIIPRIIDSVMIRVDPNSQPFMEQLERYLRYTQRTGALAERDPNYKIWPPVDRY